ncbi:MAG: 50S ribosomal protein L9 [Bacteroidota bacterium]
MKVILTQDVEKLGSEGDVVTVKPGYGRNFLIPKGLAALATKRTMKAHEEKRRQQAHKLERLRNDADALAKQLADTPIILHARVGEENRIFGTITTQQIADFLRNRGLDVDRRKISLHEDIRSLGVYPASIQLHPEVTAEVKVQVVPE